MLLSFATKQLREICISEKVATRKYGKAVADGLRKRLADFRAAQVVKDLVAGNPCQNAAEGHEFKVDLPKGGRLIFTSSHTSQPIPTGGTINWSKVSRIKILRIEVKNV